MAPVRKSILVRPGIRNKKPHRVSFQDNPFHGFIFKRSLLARSNNKENVRPDKEINRNAANNNSDEGPSVVQEQQVDHCEVEADAVPIKYFEAFGQKFPMKLTDDLSPRFNRRLVQKKPLRPQVNFTTKNDNLCIRCSEVIEESGKSQSIMNKTVGTQTDM